MSYKTRRYKQGLSGEKPGWLVLDKEGHRAQTRGYEQHLANQDLAEKMSETRRNANYAGGEYESSSDTSLTGIQKVIWAVLSLLCFWGDFRISIWIASLGHGAEVNWVIFFISLFVFPGGILFWVGFVLGNGALDFPID
jgi:hypothetical protein